MDNVRIAILDMNDGHPNQGLRCIQKIVQTYLKTQEGSVTTYDVRQTSAVPRLSDHDIFISSGGPGVPLPEGHSWEKPYFELLDAIRRHNDEEVRKKHLLLICHSFQLACHHWNLGVLTKRKSYSFGIMPVHKTPAGMAEDLFQDLPDPFFAVDSRGYQVVQPDPLRFLEFGAKILSIEKYRPHVKLERSIMAIRFSNEIFGTQFHPEADADGMLEHFQTLDRKKEIVTVFGEKKYLEILDFLDDPEKIALTEETIIPGFLRSATSHKLSTIS